MLGVYCVLDELEWWIWWCHLSLRSRFVRQPQQNESSFWIRICRWRWAKYSVIDRQFAKNESAFSIWIRWHAKNSNKFQSRNFVLLFVRHSSKNVMSADVLWHRRRSTQKSEVCFFRRNCHRIYHFFWVKKRGSNYICSLIGRRWRIYGRSTHAENAEFRDPI